MLILKEVGYYELVLYSKNIKADSKWDPEPAMSINDIRNRLESLHQTSPQMQKLLKLQQVFVLSEEETYLVFLTVLQQLELKYLEIFRNYSKRKEGLTLWLAYDMYEKNHEKIHCVQYEKLKSFLFEDLGERMTLKSHVFDYFVHVLQEDYQTNISEKLEDKRAFYNCNYERLKEMSGGFYFKGPAGIGRKTCFLKLSYYKKQCPVFLENLDYVDKKLFDAVIYKKSVCITQEFLYEQVEKFVPYLEFFVLIGEGSSHIPRLFEVVFSPLNLEQRYEVWEREARKYAMEVDLRRIANQYVLTPREIASIVKYSERLRVFYQKRYIDTEVVSTAIHRKLAEKSRETSAAQQPDYMLEDVVLPEKQKQKIQEALGQVFMKHTVMEEYGLKSTLSYGRGLSIMFVGPPGTGKTMSAYACANELDSVLFKVDLSSVVSKFVGETEKNLKKIFDEAKLSQTILFFDEADILFSKRTEVKDSSDKYSNMEAAFLLQEIENYDGITLLATNFLQNIDDAFKRRIKFIIEFPFPDKKERLEIFRKAIPLQMPLAEDVDIEFIANKFELSGGNIKNIIYNAACLGANADGLVEMKHFVRAIILEYEKMGKALSKCDFDIYQNLVS